MTKKPTLRKVYRSAVRSYARDLAYVEKTFGLKSAAAECALDNLIHYIENYEPVDIGR